ncbi:glycosyl transferase family 90 [Haloferula luteola]|nr:glycosyl transferase family 90 [Haloferula luteola]
MEDNTISFRVEAVDRVVITASKGFQCRPHNVLELLCDIVQNWPELLVGRSGGVAFHDGPPPLHWIEAHDLAFSATCFSAHSPSTLPFPCPYILRWPEAGIDDAESMMLELLQTHAPYEDDRMLWIGANTHPSRIALCNLGRQHPGLFDVELMEWDFSRPKKPRSKTRLVPIPDHARYKYLIDCPGNGYSARIKWLLATGRPLFIVDRPIIEPWHEDLEPWVHYVPVKQDLSDLLENHARLETDEKLYEKIGRSGRRFAATHLTVEAQLNRTAEALWNELRTREEPPETPVSLNGTAAPHLAVVTVHSSNLKPLYEGFVSSLDPARQGIKVFNREVDLSSFSEHGFQTRSWYEMLIKQAELALEVMREIDESEYFIVSDVDIHFFKPSEIRIMVRDARQDEIEFSALLDGPDYYNCGFIILKNCPKVVTLYSRVLKALRHGRVADADQEEINRLIHELDVKHRPLSPQIGTLGKQPVFEDTVFYHATFANNLAMKLLRINKAKFQMRKKRYGEWQDF